MNYLDEVMTAYTAVADVYDDVFRVTETTEKHAAWLLELLRNLGAKRVVDAAVGTGDELLMLAKSGAFEILVANDLNTAMLGHCKGKLRAAGISWDHGWPQFKVGCHAPLRPLEPDTYYENYASQGKQAPVVVTRENWEHLDHVLPSGAFDAVLCTGIGFYHCMTTDRFIAALQCWHKLLRQGGFVLVDYPNRSDSAPQMRSGSYQPKAWRWKTTEVDSHSGRRYVITKGETDRPQRESPIGWRSWNTWIVGEVAPDCDVLRVGSLTTGGAVLDMQAIGELAEASGFTVMGNALPSPIAVVDVPADGERIPVHNVMLRKG